MKRIENGFAFASREEVIIVKLWEIYLLYHPAQLYKTLTECSLGNGPEEDPLGSGRIVFKFSKDNWEERVKKLLYVHRIPVLIRSNPLPAVSGKGRQPVFR